ncbi:malectin [Limibaculum sp. FT325]|uniref:malectin domain-containing carbohydrate-binding protein n=1 Tax=Thermohalobaculum sediminis TaxID=2939436 RepID=UPI0020C16ADF|nr:malectin domain-containing carbohydrate-binding protein [Limibaculum sediminis]MCL5778084.1 malectin [Limibaculum sediminis]
MQSFTFQIGGELIEASLLTAFNVGGGAYASSELGPVFDADPGITSGKIQTRNRSGLAIGGTEDDALYQTYGFGDFSYDLAMPEAGDYIVELRFVEPWFSAPGKRVFDVALEGAVPSELDDLDLFALKGTLAEAITLTTIVTVDDGILDMDFISLVNSAIVSAIASTRSCHPAPPPRTTAPRRPRISRSASTS